MPLSRQMRGFGMAVISGTIAGAAPALILAVMGIVTNVVRGERIADLWVFAIVFGLCGAFAIVLSISIVVGLPLTVLLTRLRWESAPIYTGAGAIVGLLMVFGMNLGRASSDGTVLIGALCATSGAVTGFVWWRKARKPLVSAEA